ncbi:MAG: hypothetical protein JNJ50_32555 [Acidobacteria bacterium]|nr:hypothetical protein [Acidobacteriota bacterium]
MTLTIQARQFYFCVALLALLLAMFAMAQAQTTAFNYQGKLDDGGNPANGAYDFEFRLFDALSVGTQIGSTVTVNNLNVAAGIFTTTLDFGAAAFPGANRWLEISVRPGASTGAYTTLSPRQQIRSTPYAIKSLNSAAADGLSAACVNCVTSGQINSINSTQISGAITSGQIAVPLSLNSNNANAIVSANNGGSGDGLSGTNASAVNNAVGIRGTISAVTPGSFSAGVRGINNGTGGSGIGVWGSHVGSGWGVYGTSVSGKGVFGLTTATTGETYGVFGESLSLNGYGGYFLGRGFFSGNVGIGVTGPNNLLSVNGKGSFGGNAINTGVEPLEVQGAGAGLSLYDRTAGVSQRWVIYSDRELIGTLPVSSLRLWNAGDKVRIRANGTVNIGPIVAGADVGDGLVVEYNAGFAAIKGINNTGFGSAVSGISNGGAGVSGQGGTDGIGVFGTSFSATGQGVYGQNTTGGFAGYFEGDVVVTGRIFKSGGAFKIDHPLDPENKYLSHSFVESPEMMNIYNGNVTTDAEGQAVVTMPEWFQALNRDFRYQLTVIGTFAQAIVAEEISDNSFKIKTSAPNVKVSWQVTGVRQDAFANKHRIKVEEDKPATERGFYLHPDAFNQPEEKGVNWARNPGLMRELKESRERSLRGEPEPKPTLPPVRRDNQ